MKNIGNKKQFKILVNGQTSYLDNLSGEVI